MNSNLVSYYHDRAGEYEKVYSKPERQKDLMVASEILKEIFSGKDLLEIACGTGYWTQKISVVANNILATDINEAVIDIAKSKIYSPARVSFNVGDLFSIPKGDHDNLFGGFIWSHIKLEELNDFINCVNNLVKKGGTVVLMDNIYVPGSNYPITDTDDLGNTHQTRILENGSSYKVLKNFATEEFIRNVMEGRVSEMRYIRLQYFWILVYKTI